MPKLDLTQGIIVSCAQVLVGLIHILTERRGAQTQVRERSVRCCPIVRPQQCQLGKATSW